MKEKFSLKDTLFNPLKVGKMASEIKAVYADFEQEAFEAEVLSLFPRLKLKERINHMRDMLKKYLPDDYRRAVQLLLYALPAELDPKKKDDDFGDFIYAPYGAYVAAFGCNKEDLDFSLLALREITKRFSVELVIRDFINAFPKETLQMLEQCSFSKNYHKRRLASEGLRPKLPWAKKLTFDYHKALFILDNIFHDETRYVTRSVANHLNDISKVDAPLVVKTLKRWKASGKQEEKEMGFIINHALRTLVKEGNADALALLGYKKELSIQVHDFSLYQKEVSVGESLDFSFVIESREEVQLMVDYVMHFRTKAGKLSPKVHRIKKLLLLEDSTVKLEKKHHFKAHMTTRKLYAGEHKVALQINGKVYADLTFELLAQ